MGEQPIELRDARRSGWWWSHNEVFDSRTRACDSNARFVYLNLCRRANQAGQCWPGLDTIAADCYLSRSTVVRALAILEAAEWITRELRPGQPTLYTLQDPTATGGAAPRAEAQSTRVTETRVPPGTQFTGTPHPVQGDMGTQFTGTPEGLPNEGLPRKDVRPARPQAAAADPDLYGGRSHLRFRKSSGEIVGITDADRRAWQAIAPAADVEHELGSAARHLVDNPQKVSTRMNVGAFLSNWFRIAYERATTRGARPGRPSTFGGNNDAVIQGFVESRSRSDRPRTE